MKERIPSPENLPRITQNEIDNIIKKHKYYLEGRHGGARASVKYKNLSHLNLSECDLSQADFTGSLFLEANLSQTSFKGALFFASDLRNANLILTDFTRADLRGAYFAGANFSGANLTGADLREGKIMTRSDQGELVDRDRYGGKGAKTIFSGTRLSHANLQHIQAKSADFSDADLTNVNLQHADLYGATFKGANLANADFSDSNISYANMDSAILTGTLLEHADRYGLRATNVLSDHNTGSDFNEINKNLPELLRQHKLWVSSAGKNGEQLDLSGYDLRNIENLKTIPLTAIRAVRSNFLNQDLSEEDMQSGIFDGSDFRDCNFLSADLRGSSFKSALLTRANFSGTNFSALKFDRTNEKPYLKRFDASGADFRYATIDAADLRDSIFMGTDLTNAVISDCNLNRADFTGAILKNTTIQRCSMEETMIDHNALHDEE